MKTFVLTLLIPALTIVTSSTRAFQVETNMIPSIVMNNLVPVDVILPNSYDHGPRSFPVLYLLHGATDNESKWLRSTSVGALADAYEIIVVCPSAGLSWYFDSPVNPKLQYETFVSRELVEAVDQRYRTRADHNHRAIAGNSMGGHGALFLAIRHPEIFGIAVCLSGGVDFRPFPDNWGIKEAIGTIQEHPERWNELVVVNQAKRLKDGDLAIAIDCGTDDFFIAGNRVLHQELLAQHVSHDYIERAGGHDWAYWSNAIKFQMLYISEHFKRADLGK